MFPLSQKFWANEIWAWFFIWIQLIDSFSNVIVSDYDVIQWFIIVCLK